MNQFENRVVWLASVVSTLVLSTTALAQESTGDAVWQEDLEISAIVGATFGQKNFVESEQPELGTEVDFRHAAVSLGVAVGYSIDRLELSASTAFVNIEEHPYGTDPPYQWRSTFLGARWNQEFVDESLQVSPFVDVAIPTGEVEWDADLIIAPIVGVDVEYTAADRVSFGLCGHFRRNVHEEKDYTFGRESSSIDPNDPIDPAFQPVRIDGVSHVTDVTRKGAARSGPHYVRPSAFELIGKTRDVLTVGGHVAVEIVEPLKTKIGYAYHRFSGYSFDVREDPFQSDVSELPGQNETEPEVAHIQTATVDVIYTPIPEFSIGGGIATTQPTRDLEDDNWRFPLWNSTGAANNFSKLRLYVEYSY